MDLRNSVQKSHADFTALKEANSKLVYENEHLKNELEKLRAELQTEIMAGDRLRQQQHANEQALQDLTHELNRHRSRVDESKAVDGQEIASLQGQLRDAKYQCEQYYRELQARQEEISRLNRDGVEWRTTVDGLQDENGELRRVVEEVELKNRSLVEKLNEQIYMKATEYKEKTLQALTRSDSPTKLKRIIQGGPIPFSDQRLNQVLQDENRPPPQLSQSPLKQLSH